MDKILNDVDKILNEVLNFDYQLVFTYIWDSITFEMVIKFFVVYFFVIWISVIIWVIKDINSRTNNIFLQILSIFIILFGTPFSIFIYLIIRPSKTLFEKCYDEIESNLDTMSHIIEEKNKKVEDSNYCFNCRRPISSDFRFCPNCRVALKMNCNSCEKIIYVGRFICPYCGEENDEKEIKFNKNKDKNNKCKNKLHKDRDKIKNYIKPEDLIIINQSKDQEEINSI